MYSRTYLEVLSPLHLLTRYLVYRPNIVVYFNLHKANCTLVLVLLGHGAATRGDREGQSGHGRGSFALDWGVYFLHSNARCA